MHNSRPAYRNPPVAEAVIGLQLRFTQPPTSERFNEFHQHHIARFPTAALIQQFQVAIASSVAGEMSTRSDSTDAVGIRLSEATAKRILQIGPDSFVFSCFPPYCGWDSFRDEARALWEDAVAYFQIDAVKRIGLRYVNQINIPGEGVDLKDYFNLYPNIPDDMPQVVHNSFMQLQMPQSDLAPGGVTVISQGLVPPNAPGIVTILYDIDLSAPVALGANSEATWQMLESFRDRKNELFESGISENTRRLFE